MTPRPDGPTRVRLPRRGMRVELPGAVLYVTRDRDGCCVELVADGERFADRRSRLDVTDSDPGGVTVRVDVWDPHGSD